MQSFDPIFLQRLVDGELDRLGTRKLLELAETNPHLWREMASAFVENQFWQQDFEQLDRGDVSNRVQPVARHTTEVHSRLSIPNWFSLAAGILLALTTGLLIGRNTGGLTGEGYSPDVASNRSGSVVAELRCTAAA